MRWAYGWLVASVVMLSWGCSGVAEDAQTVPCSAESAFCGESCTALLYDPGNCGECGRACGTGEVCSAGTCALSCQAGLLDCGGSCIDPMSDRAFCGASGACSGAGAGMACGAGEVCSGGACLLSCQPGLVDCGGRCVDPLVDPRHCGADAACTGGTTCPAGNVCDGGNCRLTCQAGLVDCNGRCVDPMTDRSFCGASGACAGGAAGSICATGEVCSGGACALSCQAGLVSCNGWCVDPLVDPRHCGADAACGGGATCAPGNVCDQGTCRLSCQAGLVDCKGRCVDPKTDRSFCGASGACAGGAAGSVCAAGEVCSGGACALSCQAGLVTCGGRCVDTRTDRTFCGADAGCAGGTVCAPGELCSEGDCVAACPAGQHSCGGRCVDPLFDPLYCGAAADCTGGTTCGPAGFCSNGACYPLCEEGDVFCSGTCVDPKSDPNHCGATGYCSGATAGAACARSDACIDGACVPWPGPDLDWRADRSTTAAPRFPEGPSTLAHIVFDGSAMVDSTGNTRWTQVGSPPSAPTGMWTPTQYASGPFSAADHWVGDLATKVFLDLYTAGDFTVCARYRPGSLPRYENPSRIVIANGKPEPPGTGGWALMQMHLAYCLDYRDDTADGLWMAFSSWGDAGAAVGSMEWSWQCGGRDGAIVRGMREGNFTVLRAAGGQLMRDVAGFQPSPDPPTIGAYADGTGSLEEGGIYEVIITSEPATEDHMRSLVASASGGMRTSNEVPVYVTGADGETHVAPPSTVKLEPDGYMLADQRVSLGPVTRADSTVTGVCYGLEASAADWAALPPVVNPLEWRDPASGRFSQMHWDDPVGGHCVNVGSYGGFVAGCGAPPPLLAGSRHTFVACFDPADQRLRLYADEDPAPYVVSQPAPLAMFPRLDQAGTSLEINAVSSGLRIYRVFACSTADRALCR